MKISVTNPIFTICCIIITSNYYYWVGTFIGSWNSSGKQNQSHKKFWKHRCDRFIIIIFDICFVKEIKNKYIIQ